MKTVQDAIDWANRGEPPEVYITGHPKRTQKALQILAATVQEMREFLEEVKADSICLGYPDYSHIPSKLAEKATEILKR